MRVGIVARKGNDRAVALADDLCEVLRTDEVDVVVDPATAEALEVAGSPVSAMADCPLVVSVGGDGTFLYAARHAGGTPILGVNLGEVGFLNAVGPDEAVERVREQVARIREAGGPAVVELPRVEVRGGDLGLEPAVNEIVVAGAQRGRGNDLELEVAVDGGVYTAGHADGVLVATPTGSTAYNLSEGGPLVHPDVEAMVVTGMCPTDGMPPLVIGPGSEVVVTATGADRAVVASDGDRRWVEAPVEVCIGLADEPVRIAGPRSVFFEALRKLDRGGPGNGKA